MNAKKTNLVIKHCDDFDVVSTEILTTTRTIKVLIDTPDGQLVVSLPSLKYYVKRRKDRQAVGETYALVEQWLDEQDLDDLAERLGQIGNETETGLYPNLFLDTSKVLNMSVQHLSSTTLDDIARRPDYYHAIRIGDDFDDDKGWLMTIPGGMGRMPQDLWDCFVFADRMDASFVCFKPYAPLYADITSKLNIGDCPM